MGVVESIVGLNGKASAWRTLVRGSSTADWELYQDWQTTLPNERYVVNRQKKGGLLRLEISGDGASWRSLEVRGVPKAAKSAQLSEIEQGVMGIPNTAGH